MHIDREHAFRWLLLICVFPFMLGCADPPTLSPKAYEIASALYTACRKSDATKLSKITELTDSALDSGEITEKESDAITSIVAIAETEGDWEEALRLSRELMESQVKGR